MWPLKEKELIDPVLSESELLKLRASIYKSVCTKCELRRGLEFKPRHSRMDKNGSFYTDEDTRHLYCRTCQKEYWADFRKGVREVWKIQGQWKYIRGHVIFLVTLLALMAGSFIYLTWYVDNYAYWQPGTKAFQKYEEKWQRGEGKVTCEDDDDTCEVS